MFWDQQLDVANSKLQWELEEPLRLAQEEKEWEEYEREARIEDVDFYKRYPDLRPTRAEAAAEALRDKADRIEELEWRREMEIDRKKSIADIRRIIQYITSRTGR